MTAMTSVYRQHYCCFHVISDMRLKQTWTTLSSGRQGSWCWICTTQPYRVYYTLQYRSVYIVRIFSSRKSSVINISIFQYFQQMVSIRFPDTKRSSRKVWWRVSSVLIIHDYMYITCIDYLTSPHLTSSHLTMLTLPYLTLPYLTLPYLTLFYLRVFPALSNPHNKTLITYLILPYLTVPYITLQSALP